MVRDRVVRLVPSAALGLAPHDSTLINIETIMWVDAPKTQNLAPLTILGQRVTVSLTLDHVTWTFGDKDGTTTTSPGKAYDKTHDPCHAAQCPHYFGHTYRTSGAETIHATAAWQARFSVAGGRAVAIPGTVAGPQAATTVTVRQARAVLVPDPGGH